MKRYKRYQENDDKIISCKIANKIYDVNTDENEKEFEHLLGKNLTQVSKVFYKELKLVSNPKNPDYKFKGKLDITIEGLLTCAYNLTKDKIFKNLNELILTIFGKTKGSLDYWAIDLPEGINFSEVGVEVDFTFLYNQELDITIDLYLPEE